MKDKWCLLCAGKGLKKKLKYCQVNFDEGLTLCENTMCVYPFGSTDVTSLLATKEKNEKKKVRNADRLKKKMTETQVSRSYNLISQFYWNNTDSLCWLDAVLTVLVNNKCLQLSLGKQSVKNSILEKLCNNFLQAQELGPVPAGRMLLNESRNNVFEFLKPKMQCELGKNDCSLTALVLLLKENAYISEKFMLEYCWRFTCDVCGYVQVNRFKKLVITFPNTTEEFEMPSGYFLCPCYKCKAPGQKCTLQVEQLPPCVIVHFVEGVKNKEFLQSQFCYHGKDYQLCQLIQYKRNPDHFVSWVRNSNGTHWAEVDDMNDGVCMWKRGEPSLPENQIHIALLERTSLYHNNISVSTTCPKMTIGNTRNQSEGSHLESNTVRTPVLKELPLPQSVGYKKSASSLNNDSRKVVKESYIRKEKSLFSQSVTNVTKNLKNELSGKRKDSGNFQPYIPRKKRTASEHECSDQETVHDMMQTKLTSNLEFVDTKTFLPWQDGISVDDKDKQSQLIGDNQSESGYSSPGSNSSCLSIPVTSVKEDSFLADFFNSLDSLDLPSRTNPSIVIPESEIQCSGYNDDINDIVGEIISSVEFQKDLSCHSVSHTPDFNIATTVLDDKLAAVDFEDFLLNIPQ